MAAAPVSPEVAPTMVARWPRAGEDMLHQPAEELHGQILEGEGRPVEQLEQEEIVAKLRKRRDGDMVERAIGGLDHRPQSRAINRPGDEGPDDGLGHRGIGPAGETGDLGRRQPRIGMRQIKAAVLGEARDQRIGEG